EDFLHHDQRAQRRAVQGIGAPAVDGSVLRGNGDVPAHAVRLRCAAVAPTIANPAAAWAWAALCSPASRGWARSGHGPHGATATGEGQARMLSVGSVVLAALLWLGVLFAAALYGERHSQAFARHWRHVYALSLAVHCT